MRDGAMKITALDLCIDTPSSAQSDVYISGVNAIDLQVVDKVNHLSS